MSKKETITELRKHLARMFDSRYAGATGDRHAFERGYADGYMRALEDLAVVADKELLAVIGEERQGAAARADNSMASLPPGPPVATYA